jgi:DNA polymerase-1
VTVSNVPATRAWLETNLTAEALNGWKRTDSGLLSTEAAELLKASLDHPEIRPLIAVRKAAKRLEAFGDNLISMVSEVTGRLHGDYFLPTRTGRLSCRKPAIKTFSQDVRDAVLAPEGRVFVDADLAQIELRTVAALAGEQTMRAAFSSGQDIHALTAAAIVGCPVEEVTAEQRAAAKPANFGLIFGMGTRTLRDYAWSDYGLSWSFEQADAVRNAFFELYPQIRAYQREQADRGRDFGVLYSIAGRPRKAAWEPTGELWFTDCCNYGVQSSAADVLLDAMARIDRVLPSTLGG